MTKQRILVVEDEPDVRKVYADILTTEGFEVVLAASGREALRVVGVSSGGVLVNAKRYSTLVSQAIHAMQEGDAARAGEVIARLDELLGRAGKRTACSLDGIWDSFTQRLHRRGYFVSAPEEIRTSLEEIKQVGEGFDLYDLARPLARLDARLSECLGRIPARLFPDLVPFAPRC